MADNENADKIQCPKCKGMMVPNVVKEGCGGNRTERVCPLCGKVLSKKGMACCFIATAAYGTPLDEKVSILCSYRDEHLLKSPFGQNFIDFYYKHRGSFGTFLDKLICRLNLERVLGRLSNQYFKERPIRPLTKSQSTKKCWRLVIAGNRIGV